MSIIVPLSEETRIKINKLRSEFPTREEFEEYYGNPVSVETYEKRTLLLNNAVNNLAGYYDGSTLQEPRGFRSTKEASDTLRYLVGAFGVNTGRENGMWEIAVEKSGLDLSAEAQEIIQAAQNMGIEVRPKRGRGRE